MNVDTTGTMRLLVLIMLTSVAVACTGGSTDTTQFQVPMHGPDALEKGALVPERAVPGMSADVAPRQPSAADIPAALNPPAAEPAEPMARATHAAALSGISDRFSGPAATASFKPDTITVEDILEHGLRQGDASPVHIAFRGTPGMDSIRCDWRT